MLGKSPSAQAMEVVRPGDLIPDNRLALDAQDLLEHDAIARGVAEIAWSAEAPVNIALFGPWGSGKSSVYTMVEKHLKRIAPGRVRVVRYDAWKYGGEELKRNFITSVAQDLGYPDEEFNDHLHQPSEEVGFRLGKWLTANAGSLVLGLCVAVAIAALWVLALAGATWLFTDDGFKATAKASIVSAGTVFGLALVAVLVGPKVLEGAVVKHVTTPPSGDDQFATVFGKLIKRVRKDGADRLVVFIDELDRCDPKDVVATLIDLKTFLDQERCAFIVAADREVIERALREVPQAKPVREDEPYYATAGAFLDKIFQHQLSLPPLRSRALTKFAHDLVDDQGGIWEELRDHGNDGQDAFDRAVFALVPVHVRSPRRVKVLLNNFATNARIAGSRGIDWLDRAHEIAVLTVLQTEFPAVADELRRVPRLLTYLRDQDTPSAELRAVVDQFRFDPSVQPEASDIPDDDPNETPAGQLLSDDNTVAGARELEVADRTLRRHLASYLAKVAAAGIRDPRPDLLYLQAAGDREALANPKLGDAIDFATDTAPDSVVTEFANEPSVALAAAIPLLVIEGDGSAGPGQRFAYESACRLIEHLDPDDQSTVAQQVAPSLIAAATADTLSTASIPGALLVACWTGAHDVVNEVLARVAADQPSEGDLDAMTVLLPHLDDAERALLVGMLAEQFGTHQQPLLTALRETPIESAVELWSSVGDQVLAVLNELEVPEVEEAEPAVPATTRAAQAAAEPEPTGDGVALLGDIIDVVRERSDHEALLSAVVATAQSSAAAEPLRDWVAEQSDALVRTMSSATRRAKHALVGMDRYRGSRRDTWAALLPDASDAEPELGNPEPSGPSKREGSEASGGLAAEVVALANELLAALLGRFATADDPELHALPALVVRVAGWSSTSDEDRAATVRTALEAIGWTGGGTDGAAGQLLWDRKELLLTTTADIASTDDSSMLEPFVDDLEAMLEAFTWTDFSTAGWRNLAGQLPKQAAETLSGRLDEYEPADGEAAAALDMKLAVRAVFGGPAPAASDIQALDATELTTSLIDAWLALKPAAADARAVLPIAPFTPAALGRYCSTLNTDDRTAVWLALRAGGAADGVLRAAGQAGLGVAAVEAVRTQVAAATREPDRADLARQLTDARPASDVENDMKKAVSELALALLEKRTVGDFRTAATLVSWVGGAGHGYTANLRQQFNDAPDGHRKALPQGLANALVSKNLMSPPPKKKKRRLPRFGL